MSKTQQMVHVIDDACQSITELAILVDIPVETQIHRLVVGVHEVRKETTKF